MKALATTLLLVGTLIFGAATALAGPETRGCGHADWAADVFAKPLENN